MKPELSQPPLIRWGVLLGLCLPLTAWAGTSGSEEVSRFAASAWSVLPPLLAIGLALWIRQVIPALFVSIWLGAWLVADAQWSAIFPSLLAVVQHYILNALADPDHAAIIIFTLMIGGMVGVISANGGMAGLVDGMARFTRTRRSAQVTASLMGFAVFFDDYANTLVVGNTLRPVADRLKISREKLAYIVDSTSAPVAALALITTWIGYEVGLIDESIKTLDGVHTSAYEIFLSAIPYSFYPLLALFFVLLISASGRDFGPMLKAEQHAMAGEHPDGTPPVHNAEYDEELAALQPKPGQPHRMRNALLPITLLIGGVAGGLWLTGEGNSLREIIGSADSYKALLWASTLGVLTAIGLSLAQGILTLEESIEAWFRGIKSMLMAMLILILAWSLAKITEELHTADFLIQALGSWLPVALLPTLVFLISAATAFATGSSWGTMGILVPLVLPLSWAMGVPGSENLQHLYASVACILAGSVWGDHCSPISDTTILSSTATGCDHIAHVRTQLPYALLTGGVAIVFGTLPAGFGLHWSLSLLLGGALLTLVLFRLGKKAG